MVRLHELLVTLGFASDLSRAKSLVNCGLVFIGDKKADSRTKVSEKDVAEGRIRVRYSKKFVSRGAEKFEAVFKNHEIDIDGKTCLDLGASTGGFTERLLNNGAALVYAVDVGRGILDNKLRQNPRVVVLEGINARYLDNDESAKRLIKAKSIDIAVADLSFISLKLVIPAIIPYLKEGALFIPLVKPQFEAPRDKVQKGGLVLDNKVIDGVMNSVSQSLAENGFEVLKTFPSALKGPSGNIEYFIVAGKKN
ncbi:MAG: TlyA family RNA methyltransferase [Oligoflexia bacterium]|nr:TlyA family RNA methyltransferase [Oligoflexia bacterium]